MIQRAPAYARQERKQRSTHHTVTTLIYDESEKEDLIAFAKLLSQLNQTGVQYEAKRLSGRIHLTLIIGAY